MRVATALVGLFFPLSVLADTAGEGSDSTSEPEANASEESSSEESSSEEQPVEVRAQPMDLPPKAPPKVPEPLSGPPDNRAVAVTGEIRGVLLGSRLDTLDARVPDQNPELELLLPFVALSAQASLGEALEAVIAVRFDDGAVVSAWNEQGLWDARIGGMTGAGGHVTAGLLPSALGFGHSVIERFGGSGGVDQWLPLAWASGLSPARVLGLSFQHPLGPRGQVHIQAAQNPDWLGGESGTAVVEFHGGRRRGLQVSGSLGGRFTVAREASFEEGSVDLAAGLVAEAGGFLLTGELLVSLEENGPIAWELAGLLDLPWRLQGPLPLELLLRLRDTNPTAVTEEDRLWQVASGLTWRVVALERAELSLGAIWEVDLPEDVAAAIEHEASLGLHARF